MLLTGDAPNLNANSYVRMMPPRLAPTSASSLIARKDHLEPPPPCTSGSQGVGFAYEAIKHGYQDVMLVGGVQKSSVASEAMAFDHAVRHEGRRNDEPSSDSAVRTTDRDGLVVGRGRWYVWWARELTHAPCTGARV